jgi:transcription initiation factor IIE alpha subunit
MTMRFEDVVKVWERAGDPMGFSVSKLSRLTGIELEEVKKIVAKLKEEGFLEEKQRRGFTGWIAKGTTDDISEIDLEDE